MIVLGIDPGYERLGFAIATREAGRDVVLDSGCLQTKKTDDFPTRLATLGAALEKVIALAPLAGALLPFVVAAAPFVLAAVGIGAAAMAIYDNWADIGLFFTDLWRDTGDTFSRAWAWISPIVDKISGAVAMIANPMGTLMKGGAFAVNALLGTGAAPAIGATKPQAGGQSSLEVKFANMPKGASVIAESSQPLNMSVGRSMLEGT